MAQKDSPRTSNIECARLNWTLEGTPPLMTASIQTAEMEGGAWELTLVNAMGKTESFFFLYAPEETTDFNISFASTGYSNEFITDKASKDQPETSFLLTGAGFVTLVSNGVVVLLIILLVIGIAVRRRGRRSRRALLEDLLLQQRRPLPQPPQMQQRHQIPRTHQERPTQPTAFQATVSVSNAVSNERRSESSESDIYDNPNEEPYKGADGATGANVAALACTETLPDDYLTPVTFSRVAVVRDDLPDDYLQPIA
ncbi:hypothetical protein V1264_017292 [Littorina saxatilis]|uniref:Uncharacterized protein n=1 Tax=Littorina saxatilis TaxID=31220 RepID=A0AAN9BJC0_9CAEN